MTFGIGTGEVRPKFPKEVSVCLQHANHGNKQWRRYHGSLQR